MQTHELVCHPDTPARGVTRIGARIEPVAGNWLALRWRIDGAGSVIVPPFAGRGRADELWRTTCFELFVRTPGEAGYVETNLSPSDRWALYDFDDYRAGMRVRPSTREADCTWRPGSAFALFDVLVPLHALPPRPWSLGLSAVIEEAGGQKSYWALAHPPGAPDFHHPACFAASLAPPQPS